jgi:endogenous inhibitor of DNA gyrase (YacG/DUF329 family)
MNGIVEANCPYCGEPVDVMIDTDGGERQEYVEDCPVCCQPWQVTSEQDQHGAWSVVLRTADDG